MAIVVQNFWNRYDDNMKNGKKQEEIWERKVVIIFTFIVIFIALVISIYWPVVLNFSGESAYSYPDITLEDRNTSVKSYKQSEKIPFTSAIAKSGYSIDTTSINDYGLEEFFFADKLGTNVYAFYAFDTDNNLSSFIKSALNYAFTTKDKNYKDNIVKKSNGYLNGYRCSSYISEISGIDNKTTMILYQVALDNSDGVAYLMIFVQDATTELLTDSNELIRTSIKSLRLDNEEVDEKTKEENYKANEAYYKQLEEEKSEIYSGHYEYYLGPVVDDYTQEDLGEMKEEAESLEEEPLDYDTYYSASGIELTERKYEECTMNNNSGVIYLLLEIKGKNNSSFVLKSPDMSSKYTVVEENKTENGRVVWIEIKNPIVGTYTLIQSDSRDAVSYYYFYSEIME